MKLLVQRVSEASVKVGGQEIASINEGVLVFVGFDRGDKSDKLKILADKLLNYKIFNDKEGKVGLSLLTTQNDILLVPQVTLSVGTNKGTKPSFSMAAPPDLGEELFLSFITILENKFKKIQLGQFGADMSVNLINEGPITFWFDL